jgi:hypothetical protein
MKSKSGALFAFASVAIGFATISFAQSASSGPTSLPTKEEVKLECPLCIPSIDLPTDEKEVIPRPTCGMRDGWLCCNERNCRTGLRCIGEKIGDQTEKICRKTKAGPYRSLPRLAASERLSLSGGIFGSKDDRIIGGPCPKGTKRERNSCQAAVAKGSGGQCYFDGWVSESETDCRCKVHLGVPAFQGLDCDAKIKVVSKFTVLNAPPR